MVEKGVKDLLNQFIEEKYLTKKEILYRLPRKTDSDSFWEELLCVRRKSQVTLPLYDQENCKLWYCNIQKLQKYLEKIDLDGRDSLVFKVDDSVQRSIAKEAIIDEAFHSSVIEGAISTRKRAKEMIEKNLAPEDKSEQMIINNFKALEYILENIDKTIDEEITLNVYKILTKDTLSDDDQVDKYRTDLVYIYDIGKNDIIYVAPPEGQVQVLMDSLYEFIQQGQPELHPVIKSCIFHFYFVYIHPFFDGNGRTARALSYMYLLQKGYDFFKFFSISSVILEKKNKYYKAIKDVEDYASDLTYFLDFYLGMLVESITEVLERIEKEVGIQILAKYLKWKDISLSKRQLRIMQYFIKSEKNFIFIETYRKKYKIGYQTARNDLNELVSLGLLKKEKEGRKNIYKFNALSKIKSEMANTEKGDIEN